MFSWSKRAVSAVERLRTKKTTGPNQSNFVLSNPQVSQLRSDLRATEKAPKRLY